MKEISIHPYDPYVPENATKLIIGSIAPYRFCNENTNIEDNDVGFYYGSKNNSFWHLISDITKTKLDFKNTEKAIQQRKELLKNLGIGITDIIQSCHHKDKKSDDASLENIINKPISELLNQHKSVDTLIYTSKFIASQITKVTKSHHKWAKNKREGSIVINNKEYNVIVLYSPSPNARRSISAETRYNQYEKVFSK